MALTLTKVKVNQWGSDRIYRCRATFTGVTSGTVVTGLGDLDNVQATNLTDNSRAMTIDVTTTPGSIIFGSLTSDDVVDIVVVKVK